MRLNPFHPAARRTRGARRAQTALGPGHRRVLGFEALEARALLSAGASIFATPYHVAGDGATPLGAPAPTGYTPAEIRRAYGFDTITFSGGTVPGDGRGTTIAIVNAYDNPNIAADLAGFSHNAYWNLDDAGFTFTKVNQRGGTSYPAPDPGWAAETALDVQWAHAIAPRANILLVEADSNSFDDLMTAVDYARRQSGVVAVSMSWGAPDFSGESSFDSYFTTPAGHGGVTFTASSGDDGAPPTYPAVSPNVVGVGGTTLTVDGSGNYISESGWSGSGGGISAYESQPGYQRGVVTQSSTRRTAPDVAYNADPATGFAVYDSYNNPSATPWDQWGGTSAGAPQWAALIAIANQGRATVGKTALNGLTQTLPLLYSLPQNHLHDVAGGTSTGSPSYTATAGYDLVTGRGSPNARQVVADLMQLTATTTTLTSSANPAQVGQSIPFTATVSGAGGTPGGTVQFLDGATVLGSAALSSGRATLSTSSLGGGAHGIVASYLGNATFAPSVSTTLSQVVQAIGTTTALGSSVNPSVYGQSVTLTATVTPASGGGVPTGSVQFFDGVTLLGTASLSSGAARYSLAGLSVGTHSLKAVYGGSATYAASTSATVGQAVNQAATTTALTASPNPAGAGTMVILRATVAATAPGGGTPTGSVRFFDGATLLGTASLVSGVASFSTFTLAVGTHSLTAAYLGGASFTASASAPVSHTITPPVDQNITLRVYTNTGNAQLSFAVPQILAGYEINSPGGRLLPANWRSLAAQGYSGWSILAQGPGRLSEIGSGVSYSGTIDLGAIFAPGGAQDLSFLWLDENGGSYAPAVQYLVSPATATTTALTASVTPSVYGQAVTLSATVTPQGAGPAVTGTVAFYDNGALLGSATVSAQAAQWTTSALTVGAHDLTAVYSGDASFLGSTSPGRSQTVNQAAVAVVLGSSATTAYYQQPIALSVTVAAAAPGAGVPGGTVDFLDNGVLLASATLVSGAASLTTSALGVGSHSLVAAYRGDTNFQAAAAAPLAESILANRVLAMQVQQGAAQRSYVRYVDLTMASPWDVADLAAAGGVRLTRYQLDGSGGAAVDLGAALSAAGSRLAFDFGAAGLGGDPNSLAGDGYYELALDLDRSGGFATRLHFFRLLGDLNGDRQVNLTDFGLLRASFGAIAAGAPGDCNGDGRVNLTDFGALKSAFGRRLAAGLSVDA